MDTKWQVLLSGTLTFGVPLALAVRKLMLLRRPPGDAWPGDGSRPPAPVPPPPDTPRALPECLIPKMPQAPKKNRVAELV